MAVWTFRQLGGNRAELNLAGHAAPFGRPRKSPVFETEDVFRLAVTHYASLPGTSLPTFHSFGELQKPIHINGRFRDAKGGWGFAKTKASEVRKFCRGQQLVQVAWDDLFSVIGFITRCKMSVEGPDEVAWEIEIEVSEDLLNPLFVQEWQAPSPAALMNKIKEHLALTNEIPTTPRTMRGDVFDLLDNLVSFVNGSLNVVVQATSEIDSFARAPFIALARLRGGLNQFSIAVNNLRNTYDALTAEAALESMANADEWQEFFDVRAAWSASALEALREADRMERAAALAQHGNILLIYAAKEGDTWESISLAAYQSSDRADDIVEANGVPPGQNPVPGVSYLVPK